MVVAEQNSSPFKHLSRHESVILPTSSANTFYHRSRGYPFLENPPYTMLIVAEFADNVSASAGSHVYIHFFTPSRTIRSADTMVKFDTRGQSLSLRRAIHGGNLALAKKAIRSDSNPNTLLNRSNSPIARGGII